ncbi:MAG TPA: hypothetical protein VF044_03845, partial [Actinomycetota bacterium]
ATSPPSIRNHLRPPAWSDRPVQIEQWSPLLVPVWLVVALAVALWPARWVSWTLIGAFGGLVYGVVAAPLGAAGDDLLPGAAFGIGLGTALGLIVAAMTMPPASAEARPRSAVRIVGLASLGGTLAAGGGGYGVALARAIREGTSPNLDLLTLGTWLAGGGLGWALGAAIGAKLARGDLPPTLVQRVALAAAPIPAVLVGAAVAMGIRGAEFGPPIDHIRPGNPRLVVLEAIAWTDSAIVALTLLFVALRPSRDLRRRRSDVATD